MAHRGSGQSTDQGTDRSNDQGSGERRFTGRHMLVGMLAFYAVIIGVNLTMAFSATSSWTGLLTDNVYIESRRYDEVIEANRAADASGLDVAVSQRDGRLAFTLRGAGPATRIEGARAERPVGESEDRDLALSRITDATFLTADTLPRGAWNVTLPVTHRGETHVLRRRVHVRGAGL